MCKILVDTKLYNPSIAVLEINKENSQVHVFIRKGQKCITTKLIASKANDKEGFFRVGRRTYWISSLYNFNEMADNDNNKKDLKWELYDNKKNFK